MTILEVKMLDIAAPEAVEITIQADGKKVWVNVDGICMFRACRIKHLTLNDDRSEVSA